MKRVNLKQEFHGEADMAEEGTAVSGEGPDEVAIEITGGTLRMRVPSDVPDDRVISKEYLDRYIQCEFRLEDGSEIAIILNEDRDGVDVRLNPKE